MTRGLKIENSSRNATPATPRQPVYSFAEIVEMLGVLPGQLLNLIRKTSDPFPEPALVLKNSRKKWYQKDAVLAWWERVGGKNAAVSARFEYNKRRAESRQGAGVSQS